MDKIYIRDLNLRAIIGTFDHERGHKQDLVFNIALGCDLKKAGQSDDLDDTVNYKAVKMAIIEFVEGSQFFLVEKLAYEVGTLCINFPGVEYVKVTLDKPNALRYARSVAVEIELSKDK